jgi:hypothetical protein
VTSLILPTQLPTTGGWQLADFLRRTITTPAATGGTATAAGEQLDPNELWLLDHMVTTCTSSTKTALRLYSGQVAPGYLLDGTDAGNFCVADWPTGLQVEPSASLVAVWTGAAAGAVGTLTIQGRILRKVA